MKLGLPLALIASLAALSGCNYFSPFDHPTSDAQLISAARACLDRADYQCASDDYSKIATQLDVKASESAYLVLDQQGATMGTFTSAFGTGGSNLGPGLTALANTLIAQSPGQAKRLAIYGALYSAAYDPVNKVQDPNLNALVKFLTATALAAEILAEASTGGTLHKTDVASGGSTCSGKSSPVCTNCNQTAGLPDGSAIDYTLNQQPTGSVPTIQQLTEAINRALDGLNTLGASGGFGNIGGQLSSIVNVKGGSACVRGTLIDQGVGN